MDYQVAYDAIQFVREEFGEESISIGGGEPTLHPRFFDILNQCLLNFDYVWMATNGSKTKIMHRLANIIDNCDYESFEKEDYCSCGDPDGECYCEPQGLIYQEGKLSVALSRDSFHDDIDPRIVALWKSRSDNRRDHYEIRNTQNSVGGVIAEGRAAKTGSGWNTDDCVCPSYLIRPDGKIKACGCKIAPIIGNIRDGIEDKWKEAIESEDFRWSECYKSYLRRINESEAA
jgi:hypothetical protein